MAVRIEERGGRLAYRVYLNGWESREPTKLRATAKNRDRLEKRARLMSDLMEEGRFEYLAFFPNGNRAHLFRPAAAPPPAEAQTVRTYAESRWLPRSQPPLVRRTLELTRRKHCKHILAAAGDRRLDTIDPADLEDFRALLTRPVAAAGKGLKMKTARDIIDSTFRALYRDARTLDYKTAFGVPRAVAYDPFALLKWPRKVVPEPMPFDAAERDGVLAFFWTRKRHYHAFAFLLFHAGLRVAEAVGLRWGDIDLRRGRLSVQRSRTLGEDNAPKTENSQRTIRLRADVVAVLRAVQPLRVAEGAFVFTTEAGTPLDEERFVEKHWRPALRAAGVAPRRLYATRHTFISLALMRGVKIKWLARYCGTSMDMIDRHYSKWMDGDDEQLALLGEGDERAAKTA